MDGQFAKGVHIGRSPDSVIGIAGETVQAGSHIIGSPVAAEHEGIGIVAVPVCRDTDFRIAPGIAAPIEPDIGRRVAPVMDVIGQLDPGAVHIHQNDGARFDKLSATYFRRVTCRLATSLSRLKP